MREFTAHLDISIHALHEESDVGQGKQERERAISIHALHEESDDGPYDSDSRNMVISIHALHEESDSDSISTSTPNVFQSTLSMRRATLILIGAVKGIIISIHALHEESDMSHSHTRHETTYFNPRSP